MTIQRVTVKIPQAENAPLDGWLEHSSGPSHGLVLLAHAWGGPKSTVAATYISQQLCQNGWSVLRFDSALGDSAPARPTAQHLPGRIQEVESAASWLRKTLSAPTLLIGLGLGGSAVLLARGAHEDCKAIATWGAPDFADIAPDSAIGLAAIKKPTLLLHSPNDTCVPFFEAERLRAAIKAPCNLLSLEGLDHAVNSREDANYIAGLIHAWALRYCSISTLVKEAPQTVPRGQVRVLEANQRFLRDIMTDQHVWQADEPLAAGGSDQGPDPYELLLSALGACTSMTMRMYANRKGLKVDHLQVDLRHERRYREDCEDCEGKNGQLDVITRTLRIEGDLSDAERQRLAEIADRCPVHRTLENQPVIRTVLASTDK